MKMYPKTPPFLVPFGDEFWIKYERPPEVTVTVFISAERTFTELFYKTLLVKGSVSKRLPNPYKRKISITFLLR